MKHGMLGNLLLCIIICEVAGIAGSVFTIPSIPVWYASLQKPGFSPPNWIFAPVWTALFALMGISLYLVVKQGLGKREVRTAVFVFAVQLALNAIWSFLFFGLQNPYLGLVEIAILWVAILLTTTKFYPIDRRASYLLVPYILWVTFAAFLNCSIWMLNV